MTLGLEVETVHVSQINKDLIQDNTDGGQTHFAGGRVHGEIYPCQLLGTGSVKLILDLSLQN